jgi:hypothetical protein
VAVLSVIGEILSGAKIKQTGKKQGNPGALTLPSTHSRPNESHISAKRQDDAPIVQIWNRELSGNPSFGVTNCKAIRVRRLLDAIKFTCGRFLPNLAGSHRARPDRLLPTEAV